MDFAEGNGACSMADSPAPAQPQSGPEKARTKARKQLSKSQASLKLQTKDVAGGAGKTWQCLWLQWHVSFSSLSLSLLLLLSLSHSLSFLECFYEQLCILCQYFCILHRVLFVQSPDEHD